MAVIRNIKGVIDVAMGIICTLAMLALFCVAVVLGYQLVTGNMPEDDTVYVCTLDGERMRCEKEER